MKEYKLSIVLIYKNYKDSIRACLESIKNIPLYNIEIICVNNGSTDDSEKIVMSYEQYDKRFKLIKLPEANDEKAAKLKGLGIASGDFIYFIDGQEQISSDIQDKIFLCGSVTKEIKNNKVYRRDFFENYDEINEIINERVEKTTESIRKENKENNILTDTKLDKFFEKCAENIQNKNYDLSVRFNQLENNFYSQNNEYKDLIKNELWNSKEELKNDIVKLYESISNLYSEISKVYEYINGEIDKKGTEIGKLYDEITKNYGYTENLVDVKFQDFVSELTKSNNDTADKIKNLEKEIILRHVNLKRITDIRFDETESRIEAAKISTNTDSNTIQAIETEKNVEKNLDNVYSVLNNSASVFYEELSKTYKDLNDKLNKYREEEKYLAEKRISEAKEEIKNELLSAIKELKEEIKSK